MRTVREPEEELVRRVKLEGDSDSEGPFCQAGFRAGEAEHTFRIVVALLSVSARRARRSGSPPAPGRASTGDRV